MSTIQADKQEIALKGLNGHHLCPYLVSVFFSSTRRTASQMMVTLRLSRL